MHHERMLEMAVSLSHDFWLRRTNQISYSSVLATHKINMPLWRAAVPILTPEAHFYCVAPPLISWNSIRRVAWSLKISCVCARYFIDQDELKISGSTMACCERVLSNVEVWWDQGVEHNADVNTAWPRSQLGLDASNRYFIWYHQMASIMIESIPVWNTPIVFDLIVTIEAMGRGDEKLL